MHQPHGGVPHRRGVDGVAAADEAAALHKVIARLQFLDEFMHVLDGILVIAIDGQHALVAAVQGKVDAHAQLCPLLAGAGLGQQRVDAVQLQGVQLHAAVGGATVADDNVAQGVHPGGLGAAQLGQNARSLVDNGDQQAVFTALGQQLGGAVIRHALQRLAFIFDHWNTSAT